MKTYQVVSYIGAKNRFERIVYGERNEIKNFSMIGLGYSSRKELIEGESIFNKRCSVCGGLISTHFENAQILIQNQMCFKCNFFREMELIAKFDINRMIVNGESYHVVTNNTFFKGFGGRTFNFKRFDSSEIITSRNVWYQGQIPEIWKSKIPDNAELIKS